MRSALLLVSLVAALACWYGARAPAASAGITSALCGAASDASKLAGGACDALTHPGQALKAGKGLATGHLGSTAKTLVGSASTASTALGLTAIVAWVVGSANFAMNETVKIVGSTSTPQLRSTWFSSRYWRIAGIAALLTLPFLFAAAAQALIHSDMSLLLRAALGYLPLAMLTIAIAAPVTMLLLSATDQLCAGLSSGAGGIHPSLTRAAIGSDLVLEPFLRFLVALITTACALVLWLELTIREAAVYVIVLMLPLAFAALVWPARRIWAIRAVELLVALILAKLAIVAVFELGGAALGQLGNGNGAALTAGLAGTVLLLLAAVSPWAVLRLVPMSELAGSAVGSLRGEALAGLRRKGGDQSFPYRSADDEPEPLVRTSADVASAAESEHEGLGVLSGPANAARGGRNETNDTEQIAAEAPAAAGTSDPPTATSDPPEAPAPGATDNGNQPQPDGPTSTAPAGGSGGDRQAGARSGDWGHVFEAENYSADPIVLGSDGDVMNVRLFPQPDGEPESPPDQDTRLPGPQEDESL